MDHVTLCDHVCPSFFRFDRDLGNNGGWTTMEQKLQMPDGYEKWDIDKAITNRDSGLGADFPALEGLSVRSYLTLGSIFLV